MKHERKWWQWRSTRVAGILAALVVLYAVVGFWLVPVAIKWQLGKQVPALLNREVTVGAVRFNPFAVTLEIRELSLSDTNGEPFVSLGEFFVNVQPSSVFNRSWEIDEVRLGSPEVRVIRRPDGSYNSGDLRSQAEALIAYYEQQALPKMRINQLTLTNGVVQFRDETRNPFFQTAVRELRLAVQNLENQPEVRGAVDLGINLDTGGQVEWSGTLIVRPITLDGRLQVSGLDLAPLQSYVQDFARVELVSGQTDVDLTLALDTSKGQPDLRLTNGVVRVRDLHVATPAQEETLVRVPLFEVSGLQGDFLRSRVEVGAVRTEGGELRVQRQADGRINWLAVLPPTESKPAPDPVVEPPPETDSGSGTNGRLPFAFTLGEATVEGYRVLVTDQSTTPSVELDVSSLRVHVGGFALSPELTVPVEVEAQLNESGSLKADASVQPFRPAAEMDIALAGFDLRPFEPYADAFLRIDLQGGVLETAGKLTVDLSGETEPGIRFLGSAALKQFAFTESVDGVHVVGWEALEVSGIDAALQPERAAVERVLLTGLNAEVILDQNRQPHALKVIPEGTAPAAAIDSPTPVAGSNGPGAAPAQRVPFPITVGRVDFKDARIHLRDDGIQPSGELVLSEFEGTVQGVSSASEAQVALALRGKVGDTAQLNVSGWVQPLANSPALELTVSLEDLDLPALTAYATEYTGHPLERGVFSLQGEYTVDGMTFDSQSALSIDDLELGGRRENSEAPTLPLKTGVALLKDRQGRIALQVPAGGRLDDPSFDVRKVLSQAIMKVITKAITSPFSMLGSIVGGSGDDLSFVDFGEGAAQLTAGDERKLETLAKALYERPGLAVAIRAGLDPEQDGPALGRKALDAQLFALAPETGTETAADDSLPALQVLVPSERERRLRELYRRTFGVTDTEGAATIITADASVSATGSREVVAANSEPGKEVKTATAGDSSPRTTATRPVRFKSRGGAARLTANQRSPRSTTTQSTAPREVDIDTEAASDQESASTDRGDQSPPSMAETVGSAPVDPPGPNLETMEQELLVKYQPTTEELESLRRRRAEAVREYLVTTGSVETERVKVMDEGKFPKQPRVEMELE